MRTQEVGRDWREIAAYFALVGLLTLPFFVASSFLRVRLMPGLSVAAFAIVVPTLSAVIVTATTGGRAAVRGLFGSLARPGRHVLLMGLVAVAVPLVVALVSWSLSPAVDRSLLAPTTLLALTPLFLVAALLEEIGWSAFATHRLAQRMSVVAAGLVVGAAWAVWHVPSLIDLGHPADWIAWWSLWTVAQRVIMAHLYVRGGGWIWGPVLFHAASNLAWQAAPAAFDPRVEGLAMATIAIAIALAWRRRQPPRPASLDGVR